LSGFGGPRRLRTCSAPEYGDAAITDAALKVASLARSHVADGDVKDCVLETSMISWPTTGAFAVLPDDCTQYHRTDD
jgi:hypothetical protein